MAGDLTIDSEAGMSAKSARDVGVGEVAVGRDGVASPGDPEAAEPAAGGVAGIGEIQPFGRSVGFLLSQLGLVVARQFREVIAKVELEPRHFAVMRAIEVSSGQPQIAVAERMHIPTSSMVSLVDYLEGRGLVERRPSASDRRTRTLHLTDAGSELLERAMFLALDYERTVCGGLDAGARASLIETLEHVAANLDASPGVHPDVEAGQARPSWTEEVEPLGQR